MNMQMEAIMRGNSKMVRGVEKEYFSLLLKMMKKEFRGIGSMEN